MQLAIAAQVLGEFNPELILDLGVQHRAGEMAVSLDHHLFDTWYHAVALHCDAVLVTADDAYFNKALHLGHIMHLRDFALPSGT